MVVARGRVEAPDTKGMEQEEREHYRFRELMIRNKDKRLYRSMMKNRKQRQREAKRLELKRKAIDDCVKDTKKTKSADPVKAWSVAPIIKSDTKKIDGDS